MEGDPFSSSLLDCMAQLPLICILHHYVERPRLKHVTEQGCNSSPGNR